MTTSTAQDILKAHTARSTAPRSVLVRKTLPEHAHMCAKCSGPMGEALIYQLCDRCLGIDPEEPRVKYGQDAALESQANAMGAETLPAPDDKLIMFSQFETDDHRTKKDPEAPATFDAYVKQDHKTGMGAMSKTPGSRPWGPKEHIDLDTGHRITDVNDDFRTGYCAGHGRRVRVTPTGRGGKYWLCEDSNAMNQRRVKRQREDDLVCSVIESPECCGDGGACTECPFA